MAKLFLIGGAEDRKDDKIILKRISSIGKKIGICPTALKENPLDTYKNYKEIFESFGTETEMLDIRDSEEADDSEMLKLLDEIDTIFFTGGDQVRLEDVFHGTKFLEKLLKKVEKNEIMYCGTSAGSMIVPETIIFDGDYRGLVKGSLSYSEGFGLVKDFLIDTHFLHRIRMERICQALLCKKYIHGIGLPENGAIFMQDNECEIVGENRVTFVDLSNNKLDYDCVKDGNKFPIVNMNVSLLNHGDKFDLKKWTIIN